MHGGLSTGPRTAAGLARSKQANWKHGRYSAEARLEMAHFRELMRECREMEELVNRERSICCLPIQQHSTGNDV
jgi:hypothetical protein